jgi:hypothetical protein
MDEVASRPIWTESYGVEGATSFCFVLGMANKVPQLVGTMSKLTFVTILARTTLLKWSTQLCLVAACVDVGSFGIGCCKKCRGCGLTLAAVQLPMGRWWLLFSDVIQN